jgi:hypothetical protein
MSYKTKMIIPVVGMLLLFCITLLALNNLTADAQMKPFTGGKYEASGVAQVPGTDGVLFVDNGRPGGLFWMRLDEQGNQGGAIKAIGLNPAVIDLEGITTDGTHFYVVGSQSKAAGSDQPGLVRFRFDAQRQETQRAESISGLKNFLAENVAELRGMANRLYRDGGINIEGIAWDPRENRCLLGLRSPIINGQALVVPLRLRDPQGGFSAGNLEVENGKAHRLPLGGAGIRSIEYDDRAQAFRIISGAALDGAKTDFKLWVWNSKADQTALRETNSFTQKLKPEGVTRVTSGGRSFIFIVFDSSGYLALFGD